MRDIRFILCEAGNPHNIGACARAIANFGFSSLYLISVLQDKVEEARRTLLSEAEVSAVDSSFVLDKAVFCSSVPEAIMGCDVLFGTSSLHRQNPERDVVSLHDIGSFLSRKGFLSPAVLFGCEKRGLTKEQLGYCNYILNIPSDSRQPSMNLGQAVAVAAYELSKIKQMPLLRVRKNRPSSPEEINRFALEIQSVLVQKDGIHWQEQTRLREIRQALLDARLTSQAMNALKAILK